MKVVLFNGSPNAKGCTYTSLAHMAEIMNERGIETEIFHAAKSITRGCKGCGACEKLGRCVADDSVNEAIKLLKDADGFVFGSPVHYSSPSGDMVSFMDRLFYAAKDDMRYKPAAIVAVARRGGCTATFDVLMKYPTVNQMPVISADYWPMIHAQAKPEQLKEDEEGMWTLTTMAKNMAWMVKALDAAKKAGIEPEYEEKTIWTNFVR